MQTNAQFFFKHAFRLAALGLIMFLFWQNFSPLGKQSIEFDLTKNQFVSVLNPSTRIEPVHCENNICTQIMHEDPIYFELLLARKFDSLRVKLFYRATFETEIRIGMQTKKGWNYMLKSPNSTTEQGDWSVAEYSFPLDAALVEGRKVNFMISAPSTRTDDVQIIIHKIELELNR